jgi:hypothetical protein
MTENRNISRHKLKLNLPSRDDSVEQRYAYVLSKILYIFTLHPNSIKFFLIYVQN